MPPLLIIFNYISFGYLTSFHYLCNAIEIKKTSLDYFAMIYEFSDEQIFIFYARSISLYDWAKEKIV